MNAMKSLESSSKPFLLFLGFLLVIVIGLVDFATGVEISVSLFYAVPILLLTWLLGRWAGFLLSATSALSWLIANSLAGQAYSHPAIAYWNDFVEFGFFFVLVLALSEVRRALDREKRFAMTDGLTGATNTRAFHERLTAEVDRAKRYHHPFTLAYVDIDNFKAINDVFGHQTGDDLLCAVVRTLERNIRTSDLVARLGGDEFALLLPETGTESAEPVLQKLQRDLLEVMQGNNWPVTFSIGLAVFTSVPSSVAEVVRFADALMYSAKKNGKNSMCHQVFNNSENSFR